VIEMSSSGNSETATGTGPAARPTAISASRAPDRRDPPPRTGSDVASAVPLAGQSGHGSAAFLRLQPACGLDGRIHDGWNGVYELICPDCGDHPDLDYSEVVPRLQRLRGPRHIAQALAAYHKHLGIPWAEQAGPEAQVLATARQKEC
jgi:hypothetical protein